MAAAVLDSRVVTQPGAAHIPFAAVDFSSSFRSWWRSNNLHADLHHHHHQEIEATHTITDAPDGFNDLPDARASRDASLSSFPLPAFDKPRAWLIPMLVLDATVSTAVLSPKSSSDGAPQATVMNHRSSYHHILRPCIARPPTPTQPPLPPPSPTSPQAVTFAVPPPEADDTAADTRDMVLPTASTSLLPNAAIPYPHLEELLDDLGDWPLSATIVSQAPPPAPAAIDSSFSIVPAAVTASELLGLQIDQGHVSVAPVGVWTDHWQSIERQIVRLERKLVLSKLDRHRLLLQPQPPPSTTPPSPYVASFSAQALPDCTVASASPEPLLQQVLALRPEHVEMVVDFVSMAVALVYMPLYSSGFLFAGRWFPLYFNGHTGKAASVALPRPSSTPILDSIASLLSSQTPRFFNVRPPSRHDHHHIRLTNACLPSRNHVDSINRRWIYSVAPSSINKKRPTATAFVMST